MLDRKYFNRTGWWTDNQLGGHEGFLNTFQDRQGYLDRILETCQTQ